MMNFTLGLDPLFLWVWDFFCFWQVLKIKDSVLIVQIQMWCSVINSQKQLCDEDGTYFSPNTVRIPHKIYGISLPFLTADCQNCLK